MKLELFRYTVAGRVVTLHPSDDVIAVRFREPALYSNRARIAKTAQLGAFSGRFEVPGEKFTIFSVPAKNDGYAVDAASGLLEAYTEVARTAPVFILGSKRVIATDRLLVKLSQATPELMAEFQRLAVEVLDLSNNLFLLFLTEDRDPLELSTIMSTMQGIEYAEPDFVTIGKHPRIDLSGGPKPQWSSVFVNPDWALDMIQVKQAWLIQQGAPSVRVAILDDGVYTQHPDLSTAVVAAYDAISDSMLEVPNEWDGHGTACAGLACGVQSHPLGVRGVGGGCNILSIRIAYSQFQGGPWVTSSLHIRRGIDWAVDNDASVLSNSWGGGAPSNVIADAFDRARTQGRSGKGCVVVVAAGNEAGPVDFPGNLPGVLTISGTNELDELKTMSSSDGETWWGSNFGPEVAVAAPAVHIRSTDVPGAGGFASGDYVTTFNGTSAATPLVAGLAGLILSADNSLSELRVREIICDSADKVGRDPYFQGRNDKLGYGRVNAWRAIRSVRSDAEQPVVESEENVLRGTVKQFRSGGTQAAVFYLEQDGAVYLLKTYEGGTAGMISELEQNSLMTLSGFESHQVKVRYSLLQQTPQGEIIWGAQLEDSGWAEDSRDSVRVGEPPPNEIWMTDSKNSVFEETRSAAGSEEFPADEIRMGYVDQAP